MAEWDEARFSSREWERLPCIVSTQFMDDHDIYPGDTIRVYVENNLFNHTAFGSMDMLVIGSFIREANQNNIYCPLPLGALNPEHSSLVELDNKSFDLNTGQYYSYAARVAMDFSEEGGADMLTHQQLVYVMLYSKYVTALTFSTRLLPVRKPIAYIE